MNITAALEAILRDCPDGLIVFGPVQRADVIDGDIIPSTTEMFPFMCRLAGEPPSLRFISRLRATTGAATRLKIAHALHDGQLLGRKFTVGITDRRSLFLETSLTFWPDMPGGQANIDFARRNEDEIAILVNQPAAGSA